MKKNDRLLRTKGRWLKQKTGNFLGYKHWDLYVGKIGNVNWDLHSTLTEPIENEEEAKEQIECTIQLLETRE